METIRWRGPQGPWKKVFAWRPRNINGRWYWLKPVFRRERNRFAVQVGMARIGNLESFGYEYGDIFDVLKDPN